MVVTTTASGRLKFEGVPNRVLRNMTLDELEAEERENQANQLALRRSEQGQPAWFKGDPLRRRERAVLKDEERRIRAEIRRRTQNEVFGHGPDLEFLPA